MSFYIIIRGPLGCGKSTIAKKIAEKLGAEYFEIDRVLSENKLEDEWEDGYISQKSFIRVNEIIAPLAMQSLNKKRPVVFDGNFYWQSQAEDLINRLDFPHFVFTLKAPLQVCLARDLKRKKTHGKDAVEAVYKKSTEFDCGFLIDINKPLESCLKDILTYLPKLK